MKRNEQQEIELSKFIDKIKERGRYAMDSWRSAEDLRDEISKMCLNCMRTPEDPNTCEICFWNNLTAENQLLLNFESLDDKPKRHDWDGDND